MKRFKKSLLLAITIFLLGSNVGIINSYASGLTATSTVSKISIDENQASLKTYNIGGYNYVKLRDIAWLLNGSTKQFDVAWDNNKKSINLLSNAPYTDSKPVEESATLSAKGIISSASLYKDGQKIKMNSYVVESRTYFKLNELCQILDINLDWDEQNKLIVISSSVTNEFKSGLQNEGSIVSYKNDVIELVNEKRASAGLDKLSLNKSLDEIAQFRAQDMFKNNYFSHNSPNYGTFGDLADDFGYRESTMGENIAKGQCTPQEVVEDWINSSGHKANILRDKYEDIGIGIVEYQPGKFIWVQVFSGNK